MVEFDRVRGPVRSCPRRTRPPHSLRRRCRTHCRSAFWSRPVGRRTGRLGRRGAGPDAPARCSSSPTLRPACRDDAHQLHVHVGDAGDGVGAAAQVGQRRRVGWQRCVLCGPGAVDSCRLRPGRRRGGLVIPATPQKFVVGQETVNSSAIWLVWHRSAAGRSAGSTARSTGCRSGRTACCSRCSRCRPRCRTPARGRTPTIRSPTVSKASGGRGDSVAVQRPPLSTSNVERMLSDDVHVAADRRRTSHSSGTTRT